MRLHHYPLPASAGRGSIIAPRPLARPRPHHAEGRRPGSGRTESARSADTRPKNRSRPVTGVRPQPVRKYPPFCVPGLVGWLCISGAHEHSFCCAVTGDVRDHRLACCSQQDRLRSWWTRSTVPAAWLLNVREIMSLLTGQVAEHGAGL